MAHNLLNVKQAKGTDGTALVQRCSFIGNTTAPPYFFGILILINKHLEIKAPNHSGSFKINMPEYRGAPVHKTRAFNRYRKKVSFKLNLFFGTDQTPWSYERGTTVVV